MARPRKRPTRAEMQAQTQVDLIAAAARVFAERGYSGASVEEIAEEAGYSHGAVYSNFESKDDLFLAVFDDYVAERVKEIERAGTEAEGGFARRGQAAADQWMERSAADPGPILLQLEFIVHAARNPDLRERLGLRKSALRLALERHVEAHQAAIEAESPMSPGELALILHALGNGLALEALSQPGGVPADLYGRFVGFLLDRLDQETEGTRRSGGRSNSTATRKREKGAR